MYTRVRSGIIHNGQKVEATQVSTDTWINRIWYINTMEYYSALERKKKFWPYATTKMNLEDTMLSEISQTQKDDYYMIPLIWDP